MARLVTSTGAIAGEWVMMSIALLLVAARLYVRLGLNRDRIYWSDVWLLIATCCAMGLVICDTLAYKANAMHEFANPSVDILKIRFAVNYFFDVGMYFPKFSIIAFYYTLVPRTQPKMRIALYCITVLTVFGCVIAFCDATFWCKTDIASNWSTKPGACNAYNDMLMMRVHWAFNFTTELLNVVYPYPIVRDLKLPRRREKIGLVVVLSLGIFTIGVSLGRFVNMAVRGNGFSNYLWAAAEMCVSITVVAMTALRPLLRRIAHLIGSNADSSDYKTGYKRNSADPRTRTTRSRATHTHTSGAYWRSRSGTQHRNDAEDDTGSDVQLHDVKSGGVLKTEEIRISTETYRHEEPRELASRAGRAMGVETSIVA